MLAETHHIAHGTTSSLNALVTGNVPPVGFLTTKGHRDSIYIMNVEGRYLGRSPHELQTRARPDQAARADPEAARAARSPSGSTATATWSSPLDEDRPRAGDPRAPGRRGARDRGVAAVVVPQPGARAAAARAGRTRSTPTCSSRCRREVSPRIREFARNATTIMSTQIGPGLRDYLASLEATLRERGLTGPLLVMQSSGGAVAAHEAPATAISTVGSVAHRRRRRIGRAGPPARPPQHHLHRRRRHHVPRRARSSTASRCAPPPRSSTTTRSTCRRCSVQAIGSGGGAIAWLDAGGNLRVGPHSAQAVPGPACYGEGGTEPTNTDANLVLGILPERGLLGGRKPLSRRRSPAQAIRHPDRRAARPDRRGGRRGDLRRAERADRRPAAQGRRRGGPRPARLRRLRLRRCRPRALRALRRRGRRHGGRRAARARWRRRSRRTGWPPRTSSLAAELSDPAPFPIDPAASEQQLRRLEEQVRDGLDAAGPAVREPSSCTGRSTCATRCSSPRSRRRSAAARSTTPRRGRSAADDSSSATPSCTARAPGSARPASRPSPTGSAAIGVLPVLPDAARRCRPPSAADPAAARIGSRPVCLDARAGFVDTAGLRLPRPARRPRPRRARPSSRCRPPPWSSRGHHRHGRPPRQPHHHP